MNQRVASIYLTCGHGAVGLTCDGVAVVLRVARLRGGVGADEGSRLAHRDRDHPRVRVRVVPALGRGHGAPEK